MVDQTATSNNTSGSTEPVSSSTTNANKPHLKKYILTGLFIVIAAVLIGAGVALWHKSKAADANKKLVAQSLDLKKKYANIPDPVVKGDTATVTAEIQKETDPKKLAVLYGDLASQQILSGQKDAAFTSAQKAYELVPSAANAAKVGWVASENNNWSVAKEWYQKAVDMSPKTAPSVISDYNEYSNELKISESHL